MRERVRFERRATTAGDGHGNFEGEWGPLGTVVWAKIKPMGGNEEVLAARLTGVQPSEITVRWSALLAEGEGRLTTADRAVDVRTGDIFAIRSIENPDMRRRFLRILVSTGEAA